MIKSFFINSTLSNYTDEEFSWLQKLLMEQGIFGDVAGAMGFAVSQNGGGDMSVNVALGNALLTYTKSSITWKVVVMNSATVNVPIASNSSGSNRVDAIVIRVDVDAENNALKNNLGTVERVAGTGTSALTDGAITTALGSDAWIRLANITVANGASSILTANIADTRVQVRFNDAILPMNSANYQVTTGSANAYVATAQTGFAYKAGQMFFLNANFANTGACTLNINGAGAKTIKKQYNLDLVTGDIVAGQTIQLIYDGTNFQMLNPAMTLIGATLDETSIVKGSPINAQTGTTYTLALADSGKLVTLSNAGAITLTIPTNATIAFPVATRIDIAQLGAGKVTVGGAGVTIISKSSNKSLADQYAGGTLIKTATDTWLLIGDLIA